VVALAPEDPFRVAPVVNVPNVNKLEEDVLIIPEVIVKVPETKSGTLNVTPVAFALLIVKFPTLALNDETTAPPDKSLLELR
jgi:hypothetical protein